MSKTAVGLFENPGLADQVVRELEASGFPQNDVRILRESLDMFERGVGSFRTDSSSLHLSSC